MIRAQSRGRAGSSCRCGRRAASGGHGLLRAVLQILVTIARAHEAVDEALVADARQATADAARQPEGGCVAHVRQHSEGVGRHRAQRRFSPDAVLEVVAVARRLVVEGLRSTSDAGYGRADTGSATQRRASAAHGGLGGHVGDSVNDLRGRRRARARRGDVDRRALTHRGLRNLHRSTGLRRGQAGLLIAGAGSGITERVGAHSALGVDDPRVAAVSQMVHRHHVVVPAVAAVCTAAQRRLLALVLELVSGEANGVQLVTADGVSRVAGQDVLLVAQHHRTDLVVRAAAGALHTATVLQLRLLVAVGVVPVVEVRAPVGKAQHGAQAGLLRRLGDLLGGRRRCGGRSRRWSTSCCVHGIVDLATTTGQQAARTSSSAGAQHRGVGAAAIGELAQLGFHLKVLRDLAGHDQVPS